MNKSTPYVSWLGARRATWQSVIILITFLLNSLGPIPIAQAQDFILPKPGVMIHLSPPLDPPILRGIKIHPNDPFSFDFILDKGKGLSSPNVFVGDPQKKQLKQESTKLIKYFLASLTIPEKDLWVNLSPYERKRIIPQSFGLTEMGRDLLAEDYMLKQITASLIYPEDPIGKKFWQRVYAEAQKKFGTTNISINTFNKVWIVPEKAVIYENAKAGTAYVVESKLKVMLEEDYLSLQRNTNNSLPQVGRAREGGGINALGSQIIREVVIPQLTKEVNSNKNFAQLRQVYNSLILATWYKKKIKDSILERVYEDRKKVAGIEYKKSVILSVEKDLNKINSLRDSSLLAQNDKGIGNDVELIYQRYLKAFKRGVFNYIKEDAVFPPPGGEGQGGGTIPRKYFSGGVALDTNAKTITSATETQAMKAASIEEAGGQAEILEVRISSSPFSKSFQFQLAKAQAEAKASKQVDAGVQPNVEEQRKSGDWWKEFENKDGLSNGRLLKDIPESERRAAIEKVLNFDKFRHLVPEGDDSKMSILRNRIFLLVEALNKNKDLRLSDLEAYMDLLTELLGYVTMKGKSIMFASLISGAPTLGSMKFVVNEVKRSMNLVPWKYLMANVLSSLVLKARNSDEIIMAINAVVRLYQIPGKSVQDLSHAFDSILEKSDTLDFFIVAIESVGDVSVIKGEPQSRLLTNLSDLLSLKPTIDEFKKLSENLKTSILINEDPSNALLLPVPIKPTDWKNLKKSIGIGLGGFVYNALTVKMTSAGIHELMTQSKDIPNTSPGRLNQNRKDAYVFQHFGDKGRDFIHDQTPGVHQIIQAWIDYYDSNGQKLDPRPSWIEAYASWPPSVNDFTTDITSWYYGKDSQRVIDKLNSEVELDENEPPERIIDILRRLAKNTAPVQDAPPRVANIEAGVGFSALDEALQNLHQTSSSSKTNTKALYVALREVNRILNDARARGQVGVMPNFILALAWLEAKAFSAMREVRESRDAEYLLDELYKTPWFLQTIEFFYRIHSPSEHFSIPDLQESSADEAYQLLANRALAMNQEWAKQYKSEGRENQLAQLWSGNLPDAFLMLANKHGLLDLKRKAAYEFQHNNKVSLQALMVSLLIASYSSDINLRQIFTQWWEAKDQVFQGEGDFLNKRMLRPTIKRGDYIWTEHDLPSDKAMHSNSSATKTISLSHNYDSRKTDVDVTDIALVNMWDFNGEPVYLTGEVPVRKISTGYIYYANASDVAGMRLNAPRSLTPREIQFKHDFIQAGYHNAQDLTAASIKADQEFGRGTVGTVYRIPSMPGYLLKTKLHVLSKYQTGPLVFIDTSPVADLTNVSIPVAMIGEMEVLRILPGKSLGVSFNSKKTSYSVTEHATYTANLAKVAAVLQNEFDIYVDTVNHLNKNGYQIDGMASNLLLDEQDGLESARFNFIDLVQDNEPNLVNMLFCQLLDLTYVNHLRGELILSDQDRLYMKVIIEKLVKAIENKKTILRMNKEKDWLPSALSWAGYEAAEKNEIYRRVEASYVQTSVGKNQAMKVSKRKLGGIDLSLTSQILQTKNAGIAIKYHISAAMLSELQKAPGFVPQIINMRPLKNISQFLGLKQASADIISS